MPTAKRVARPKTKANPKPVLPQRRLPSRAKPLTSLNTPTPGERNAPGKTKKESELTFPDPVITRRKMFTPSYFCVNCRNRENPSHPVWQFCTRCHQMRHQNHKVDKTKCKQGTAHSWRHFVSKAGNHVPKVRAESGVEKTRSQPKQSGSMVKPPVATQPPKPKPRYTKGTKEPTGLAPPEVYTYEVVTRIKDVRSVARSLTRVLAVYKLSKENTYYVTATSKFIASAIPSDISYRRWKGRKPRNLATVEQVRFDTLKSVDALGIFKSEKMSSKAIPLQDPTEFTPDDFMAYVQRLIHDGYAVVPGFREGSTVWYADPYRRAIPTGKMLDIYMVPKDFESLNIIQNDNDAPARFGISAAPHLDGSGRSYSVKVGSPI